MTMGTTSDRDQALVGDALPARKASSEKNQGPPLLFPGRVAAAQHGDASWYPGAVKQQIGARRHGQVSGRSVGVHQHHRGVPPCRDVVRRSGV